MPADGAVGTLTLVDGPGTREEHGTIRAFLDEDGGERWEIVIDDPAHPAIGFLPEHVVEFVEDLT